MIDEEIKQIIQENKETLANIDKRIGRIEKNFIWSSIFGFIKIVIILGPIIFGIIYFTPFLKDFIRIYEPFFKNLPITLQNLNNPSSDSNIPTGAQAGLENFCDPQVREAMIDSLCK